MKRSIQPKKLALLITILFLFAIIIWGNSLVEPTMGAPREYVNYQNNQVVFQTPPATLFPVEMERNRSQTRGIVLGVIVLVAIIVLGTFSGIKRR